MKIYLAGPLFTLAERLFNTELATLLRAKGYGVWLPQENEPREFSTSVIFSLDVCGINQSDVIVANMDGPDPDSGTAWECGAAFVKGKPVLTYRTDFRGVGEAGQSGYNIMLWESSDIRLQLPCLKFKTVQEVADAIHAGLQESRRSPLPPAQNMVL